VPEEVFFLVYPYSHVAYLDYGAALFIQVSRSGGTLQVPLLPSAQACPKKDEMRTKEITKEKNPNEHERQRGRNRKRSPPSSPRLQMP